MYLRTLAFLAGTTIACFVVFRLLVDHQVERVVTLHGLDKARHLAHMLETDWGSIAEFSQSPGDPEHFGAFADMAAASEVATVVFYDTDLHPVARFSPAGMTRLGAGHGPDEAEGPHDEPHHETHHEAHGHGGGGTHEAHAMRALDALPTPMPRTLAPIDGLEDRGWTGFRQLALDDGTSAQYVIAILPIGADQTRGNVIGHVGFVLNVTHMNVVYAEGVRGFSVLFMIAGLVLFGVPAFAFWVQKQMAEFASRRAHYLSRHDPLTGLLNRAAFNTALQDHIAEGRVRCAGYIDADKFKLINDTYGHTAGDRFLQHIARSLSTAFGEDALLARIGGDEFTFALLDAHGDDAETRANTALELIGAEIEFEGRVVQGSVSIGMTRLEQGDQLEALLQRADIALYFAKDRGRNRACMYDDAMGEATRRRHMIEARLKTVAKTGDFRVVYQPLVIAATLATKGYEALIRMDDENGVAIPPSEFVPIAENLGLIEEMGAQMLRTATTEIAALDDTSSVSVNLSADQFQSGRLVATVQEALQKSGLAPSRLELEVTETLLLENRQATAFQIDALKEMGVSMALDDFGTGYSGLSTLWQYGFDRLKIDKSFIEAMDEAPAKSKRMIEVVVLLGKRLGMGITVEGIETEHQKTVLTELGCDVLQGFLFGKPAPIEALPHRTERSA